MTTSEHEARPAGPALTLGFLVAALFLAGGLIFLCAAVQYPARWPVALALLAIGSALGAWTGVRWRRAMQLSPAVLDARIADLAAAHDARVTLALVISALNVPEGVARAALARLEANDLCRQEPQEGKTIYLFPGLQESKVIRRCAYCGNEYSVREPLHKCPNCGGNLEIVAV